MGNGFGWLKVNNVIKMRNNSNLWLDRFNNKEKWGKY
jgi:hypothetical protein